jgi:hypothetical protein
MKRPEQNLVKEISHYLQVQYPRVIFKFDLASDQKLTIQQASRNAALHGRWSKGSPDLCIYEKRHGYGALFIELKAHGKSPYKKDGTLRKDKHLERQDEFHKLLRDRGYYASFATGFGECKQLIDDYLRETK